MHASVRVSGSTNPAVGHTTNAHQRAHHENTTLSLTERIQNMTSECTASGVGSSAEPLPSCTNLATLALMRRIDHLGTFLAYVCVVDILFILRFQSSLVAGAVALTNVSGLTGIMMQNRTLLWPYVLSHALVVVLSLPKTVQLCLVKVDALPAALPIVLFLLWVELLRLTYLATLAYFEWMLKQQEEEEVRSLRILCRDMFNADEPCSCTGCVLTSLANALSSRCGGNMFPSYTGLTRCGKNTTSACNSGMPHNGRGTPSFLQTLLLSLGIDNVSGSHVAHNGTRGNGNKKRSHANHAH